MRWEPPNLTLGRSRLSGLQAATVDWSGRTINPRSKISGDDGRAVLWGPIREARRRQPQPS
jgi:hypothetical protein